MPSRLHDALCTGEVGKDFWGSALLKLEVREERDWGKKASTQVKQLKLMD